jgi:hypothetical protein
MTSSMVARAFLLAYRIMGKIVETKGDTDWLKNGAPHCNVRRDYADTERGVKKIENIVGVDEDESQSLASQCLTCLTSLFCYSALSFKLLFTLVLVLVPATAMLCFVRLDQLRRSIISVWVWPKRSLYLYHLLYILYSFIIYVNKYNIFI